MSNDCRNDDHRVVLLIGEANFARDATNQTHKPDLVSERHQHGIFAVVLRRHW